MQPHSIASLTPPHVSVIIPNYNHARYLPQRLETVLQQSFQDMEIIILDDASTDGSPDLLQRYASDKRVQLHMNTQNSGSPFIQWNRGIRHARGDYIWIAESDDYSDPQFLAEMIAVLDMNPDVGLAYCQSIRVDETGKELLLTESKNSWLHPTRWQHSFINDGRDECARYLVMTNTIPNASAVLFRRESYWHAGGAPETFRQCGDWMTWVNILLQSKVAYVARPLNFYRLHDQTVRRTSSQAHILWESYRLLRHVISRVPVAPPIQKKANSRLRASWLNALTGNRVSLRDNMRIGYVACCTDSFVLARLGCEVALNRLRRTPK
jgi:glycosyltransferase involved in cell wall biosynthesis